jgi:hypothetical protein
VARSFGRVGTPDGKRAHHGSAAYQPGMARSSRRVEEAPLPEIVWVARCV